MLRPYVFSLHAGAPHHRRARARLHALAARRLAVPGSARVSGAAREIARSQARRRRERGASRAGLGRWNEAGGLVSRTEEARGWGRTGEVRGGWRSAEQPPPTSSSLPNLPNLPNLRWPPLVLRQR